MAYDEYLAERVRGVLGERYIAFEEKRMMGGLCFMVDGKMCVGVEKKRLMVRLDPDIYDDVLNRKGCVPMDFTGRPMRGFVFVNGDGMTTAGELGSWLDLALEYNPRAMSSKKKPVTPKKLPARTKRANQSPP
jgi:hypothetical protein